MLRVTRVTCRGGAGVWVRQGFDHGVQSWWLYKCGTNTVAEKGKQHILVCGDKKQSLAAVFASFELLPKRDEICLHHSCSFPFSVGRKNNSQILFLSLFFIWKWQTQVSRELVQPFFNLFPSTWLWKANPQSLTMGPCKAQAKRRAMPQRRGSFPDNGKSIRMVWGA